MKLLLFTLLFSYCSDDGPGQRSRPEILGNGALVVEVAPLASIGRDLPAPPGWRFHQATEKDDAFFREISGSGFSTGLLYFDGAGNLLVVDGEEGAHRRIFSRCKEAVQAQKVRDRRISEVWKHSLKKKAAGNRPGEVELLLVLAGSPVRGSEFITAAQGRLKKLEKIALDEFWNLMASEGHITSSMLVKNLRNLEKKNSGLQILKAVVRERLRIEAGVTIKEPPR